MRFPRIRIRTYEPLMRRKTNWHLLSEAELRMLMHGLSEWERRAPLGPIRTRIRRTRRAAVDFYRKTYGRLAEDRLWVPERLPKERFNRSSHVGAMIHGKKTIGGCCGMRPNSALLTDTSTSPLCAQHGAAKRDR
jgi:hypothetical protein